VYICTHTYRCIYVHKHTDFDTHGFEFAVALKRVLIQLGIRSLKQKKKQGLKTQRRKIALERVLIQLGIRSLKLKKNKKNKQMHVRVHIQLGIRSLKKK